jgi:hypothetical protein
VILGAPAGRGDGRARGQKRAVPDVTDGLRVGELVIGGAGNIDAVSYDLVFWRQDEPLPETPAVIYQRLIGGDRVEGIADLDLESFLAALINQFRGAVREPNGETEWIDWTAADKQASFQVEWSSQHVVVFCRRTSNQDMNRLINIAIDHECRLYDPQVNERFA